MCTPIKIHLPTAALVNTYTQVAIVHFNQLDYWITVLMPYIEIIEKHFRPGGKGRVTGARPGHRN
jgi:hypothetical protein